MFAKAGVIMAKDEVRGQKATDSTGGGTAMRCLALCFLLWGSVQAWSATESVNTTSSSDDSKVGREIKDILHDKKYDEDERITDLELRAQAGSRNRYSMQFNLGYAGSPINDLGNQNKPNPDGRSGDNRTNLSGTMGLRYRTSKDTGINFGTGMVWYTPYQTVTGQPVTRPKGRTDFDVHDPLVSFDKTYVTGRTQMRSSVFLQKTTTQAYVEVGQTGETGVSQYFKYTPGNTRMILGFQMVLDYFAFVRPYTPQDKKVSKYYMNFIPSFEYKITDAVNFNTSLGYAYQNLRSDNSWWRWNHQLSTWRLGVGWAITHDIYINPYINFFAEAPAFSTASMSFNTVFSIF